MKAEVEESLVVDFRYVIFFEIRQLILCKLNIVLAEKPQKQA
jgi:hypothetical protein